MLTPTESMSETALLYLAARPAAPSVWRVTARTAIVPAALALVALILYLPGFWWGAPQATAPDRIHAWGVDDETPLGPLSQLYGIVQPQANRNPGYPLMHSFVVVAGYAPYLLFQRLSGGLTSFAATYPYGLTDPVGTLRTLTLIAHLISVLMGVGIVVAAYDAGRTLWDARVGALAAVFAMLSFPMFYYARTGNVDVPVLFFTALALAVFARCMVGGLTVWRGIWLGIFVGLALATKEPSFASFVGLPFVLLWRRWRTRASQPAPGFWKSGLLAAVAAFTAFGLGSGLFVDHQFYFAHLAFAAQRSAEGAAGLNPFAHPYPYTLDGNLQFAALIGQYVVDSVTLPGLILAALGLIWTVRRERRATAFVFPVVTYMVVLFVAARTAQLRYLLPVAFTLAFFAARAVLAGWDARRTVVGIGSLVLACAALSMSLLRGVDLTYAMLNDSHYAAGAWLAARTHSGDQVEYFGYPDSGRGDQHLPALAGGVITQPAFVSESLRTDASVVEEIRQGWRDRQPRFVILTPDYLSPPGIPYSGACPPPACQALLDGALGYGLAAVFETPPLLPWVGRPALDYPVVNPPIHIFVRSNEGIG